MLSSLPSYNKIKISCKCKLGVLPCTAPPAERDECVEFEDKLSSCSSSKACTGPESDKK